MTVRPTPELVERLRRADLLTPQQWDELAASNDEFETPAAFADSLVRRGWLTPFQSTHLLNDQLDRLTLGAYRLLEPIGTGGQGEVFRALQVNLNREVAIKRLRAESAADTEALPRLRREAKAVARLAHPNIVHVYDWPDVSDFHFIVMEYVRGTDLSQMVHDRGPLPIPVACDYIRQAALGLEHAHQHGLIHRDIKPSNLLVAQSDGGYPSGTNFGLVKILDLGLARNVQADSADPALTSVRSILGTPDYISPEQARDSSDVDHRADLYSLGCTFYFLLAGHPPFPSGSSLEKILKHHSESPKSVTETRPGIPPAVLSILDRLMRKSPRDRYQKAADVADALSEVMVHTPVRRDHAPAGAGQPPVSPKPAGIPSEFSKSSTLATLPPLVNRPRSAVSTPSPVALGESLFSVQSAPAPTVPETLDTTVIKRDASVSYPSVSLLLRGATKPIAGASATPPISAATPTPTTAPATPPPQVNESQRAPRSKKRPSPAAPACRVIKAPTLADISSLGDERFTTLAHRVSVLQGHANHVVAMAFAPRGQYLTTAGLDHAVRIWRIEGENTRQETSFCDPRLDEIRMIAYAPHNGLLISASGFGGRIWHWQWQDGQTAEFQSLEGSLFATALVVAPDGKHVAAASGKQIFIWAVANDQFKLRRSFSALNEVTALAFSADGHRLYAGEIDGKVQGWLDGWRSFREDGVFAAHSGPVDCLAVSPDDRMVATAGTDNFIRIWSHPADSRLLAQAPTGTHGMVRLLQFGPQSEHLAMVGGNGRVTLFRSADAKMDKDWRLNQIVSSSFALADDLGLVAAARTDGTVCLYELVNSPADAVEGAAPKKRSGTLHAADAGRGNPGAG